MLFKNETPEQNSEQEQLERLIIRCQSRELNMEYQCRINLALALSDPLEQYSALEKLETSARKWIEAVERKNKIKVGIEMAKDIAFLAAPALVGSVMLIPVIIFLPPFIALTVMTSSLGAIVLLTANRLEAMAKNGQSSASCLEKEQAKTAPITNALKSIINTLSKKKERILTETPLKELQKSPYLAECAANSEILQIRLSGAFQAVANDDVAPEKQVPAAKQASSNAAKPS